MAKDGLWNPEADPFIRPRRGSVSLTGTQGPGIWLLLMGLSK